jgi:voltage-gated potassium channel
VCGYGATGQEAVKELLLQGHSPDQLAVIDTEETALEGTVDLGVLAVVGDAAREGVLMSVGIDRAAHILVCPGRDDAAVLIALTARDHNAKAHITAACRRKENVKLLKRAGAETIITPAAAGGNLMAAATRKPHLAETLRDMLSMGGALQVHERSVEADEVGKEPGALPGIAVVRVYRSGKTHDPDEFPTLQAGDTIIYVATGNGSE